MGNLRYKRKRIIILIIIFIIILVAFYMIAQSKDIKFQEDVIFFKLFGNSNNVVQEKNSNNQYEIKLTTKNKEIYRYIDLKETIDKKTLVHEKIAPGTKGNFDIILTSDSQMNYEIKILDENEKPKNFVFKITNEKGIINANEIKKIEVNWQWDYETNKENDIQDTKDGKNLNNYYFEILCYRKIKK